MKMKKLINLFIIISLLTITLCLANTIIKNKNDLNEVENVTMTIKEGTLSNSGATIIITDLNEEPYTYGESYRLDVKINGRWQPIKLRGSGDFILIAYRVDENNQLELTHDWSQLYGILKKGHYRLVKYVCEKDTACSVKKYFSVEFTID